MDQLPQGEVLQDKYRILSHIGQGAWSNVYLARDLHGVGQYCAVKEIVTRTLSPKDAAAMKQSFLREAGLLASLTHEGLPRIFDYFNLESSHYLVMEWIAGKTLLQELQEQDTPFPVADVVQWGMELCRILAYLHTLEQPIVVADLKPGNVMRTYEGNLKLVDFGVARYVHHDRKRESYVFVTPGFSPPEQYDGELDARCDIYALGATMYYLLTRQDMTRFKFQVPPLRRFRADASAMLEELLAKCMQTNRSVRYSDAALLRRKLQGALDTEDKPPSGQSQAKAILSSLYQSKRKGLGELKGEP